MTTRALVAIAAILTAIGCGVGADGPPHIEVDRTACAHCGMLVSDLAYAAAYRVGAAEAKVFDDIGCLLAAARREPEAGSLRFWLHDAASETWIDGRDAVLVSAPTLRTPMGGGLIAFGDRSAARDAAARHNGTVAGPLDALLKQEGS
jgi:copper chaperone NosL